MTTQATQDHLVFIGYPPGEHEGDEDRYDLECDACGHIAAVDGLDEAKAVSELHAALFAEVVQ